MQGWSRNLRVLKAFDLFQHAGLFLESPGIHEVIDCNIRSVPLRYEWDELKEPGRTLVLKFPFDGGTVILPLKLHADGLVDPEQASRANLATARLDCKLFGNAILTSTSLVDGWNDVRRQPDPRPGLDDVIVKIYLPPFVLDGCR